MGSRSLARVCESPGLYDVNFVKERKFAAADRLLPLEEEDATHPSYGSTGSSESRRFSSAPRNTSDPKICPNILSVSLRNPHLYGWTPGNRRASSNSAIKHLVSGTTMTSWLYDDPAQVHESPELSNNKIVNFIKEGKFGAADRLRLQLEERGVTITPHPVYEKAAIANLQWSDMEQCLNHFTTWFSLVPDYDKYNPPTYPGPFKDVRHTLIHTGSPSKRLPLILRFGLLSASKGYLQPMFSEIVPILKRSATADVGANWLHDVERVAVQYSNAGDAVTTARRYRACGVEICCEAGWLDHAISIVKLERKFTLPRRSYVLLLRSLRDAGRLDEVQLVERHLDINAARARLRVVTPNGVVQQPASTAELKDIPKRTVNRQVVAATLRSLKSQLQSQSCPAPIDLIRFLADFRTVGGSQRVIQWLRHRALLASAYCNISWLKAELRYHNIERNHREILRLYLTYLHTTPLPGIFPYTLTRLANQYGIQAAPAEYPKYILHDRWLVLKPIIRLVPELPWALATLRALYNGYRGEKAFAREVRETRAAFISTFGVCGAADDVRQVFEDAGTTPPLALVEAYVEALARTGHVEEAMGLLAEIEAGGSKRGSGMRVMGYDGRVEVAVARLTTYGRVIEGFVQVGMLQEAQEVERMMRRRFAYEYGLNRKLDEAMRNLWALEMEHAVKQVRACVMFDV
ncbi:hypothetical protein H0H81_002879 [Sphagnurus paluster]|uniref:Pentatricopeptide repeat domain-containing protein n=1 Tax=Sphagnurus paluster TaxID=117069 RepID=A0A9P7FRT1_9AGAR|nr:hypothetical protein H0H81_002879 [Sphagnurus paluster]